MRTSAVLKGCVVPACMIAFAAVAGSASAAEAVRVSQVYGGGGSTSATAAYRSDYIEIFNSSSDPVTIGGWVLEYGSATGNWGSNATNIFTFPKGTVIAPCSYILVSSLTPSTGGAVLPVTSDFFFNMAMSATTGKVGLFRASNPNTACGSEAAGTLVDKVAYGPTATCFEGTAGVAVLANTSGAVRNGGGMADTDSNVDDFAVVVTPVPHNAASPANGKCGGTPPPPVCPADLNGDHDVSAADLAALLGAWGTADAAADLNQDGVVGAADLAQVLGAWGPCPV